MVQASVGFHCPECVRGASKNVQRPSFATRSDPIATKVLIGLNVLVYVAMVAMADAGQEALMRGGGSLVDDFALVGGAGTLNPVTGEANATVGVAAGEWWRLLTGGFLHGGLIHLGFNMLILWILGSQLEKGLGRSRFVAIYFTSLFAGSLGVMLLDPLARTVGASGAIFGLMGAAVALQRAAGVDWWRSGLGTLLVLNLLITFTVPGISVGGHVGGLLGGLAAGGAMAAIERRTRTAVPSVVACVAMTVLFVAASLWAATRWYDPVLDFLPF